MSNKRVLRATPFTRRQILRTVNGPQGQIFLGGYVSSADVVAKQVNVQLTGGGQLRRIVWSVSATLLVLFAASIAILGCSDDGVAPPPDAGALPGDAAPDGVADRFSFFVTSLTAMRTLSGNPSGFGGDLRFGQADGLSGADEICRQIAELSKPSNGKTWRAFLSVTKGPDGTPVHAIDRVGQGPWYDRIGRLFAMTKADLIAQRPNGADPAIINDFPNESGIPNHDPDLTGEVDNHDFLTGTDTSGKLISNNWSATCHDWTSSAPRDGQPRCGHSWPRLGGGGGGGFPDFDGGPGFPPGFDGGRPPGLDGGPFPGFDGGVPPGGGGGGIGDINNWMSSLDEAGCAPGVNIIEMGGPNPADPTVGSGGGYGGIYCFALTP